MTVYARVKIEGCIYLKTIYKHMLTKISLDPQTIVAKSPQSGSRMNEMHKTPFVSLQLCHQF